MSNEEVGFEPSWGASVFECDSCGKDGMQWKQISPDRWKPYDLREKKIHSCNVQKDKEQKVGFEPSWGASVFECKFCGKGDMQWKQISPDTWVPYDIREKRIHSCDVQKDKEYLGYQEENTGLITLESLLENLKLLGFEYFIPRTSSWKLALVKSNNIQTVYFLIGRLGIDFKLYDYVRDNNIDDNGKIYTDGGSMTRNYYWQSKINIHHLILKVATQLSNNIPIDAEFLIGQGRSVNQKAEDKHSSANDST